MRYHPIADEERGREGYPKEWTYYIDCPMPDGGDEILVSRRNGKWVCADICGYDDGCGLHYKTIQKLCKDEMIYDE